MSRPFSLTYNIARRLRLTPEDGSGRSPAVAIAVAGVALAVAVMLLTLSIVIGFQDAIRTKVLGFEAPIKLQPLGTVYSEESRDIRITPDLEAVVESAIPGSRMSLGITQPVVLKTTDNFAGVTLNGFDSNHDFGFEQGNMVEGKYPDADNEIALSQITAEKLGLRLGDKLDGCFFVDNSIRLRRLTVAGIFSSNFTDYDKLTAYTTFDTLRKLRHLEEGRGDYIAITGIPFNELPTASATLMGALQHGFDNGRLTDGLFVTTVLETGAAYLGWLDLLDSNVVVILIIMTLVSGFTLISCMFILILQRVGMIGILKSIGASNGQIRRIFLWLGGRIILTGVLIGNVIGLGLVLLQQTTHLVKLDPAAYYLDSVPVELTLGNVVAVNAGAAVVALLLLLLPTSMIARISPSKTMRYE